MKKPLFYLLFFSIISASSVAESVELEEGWNTFSVSSEISESELTGSSYCDFRPVEGTDNFFFEQKGQGNYEEVEELHPWKAYYGWVSDSCTLETDNSEWDEDVELNSGEWNLIKPPQDNEVLEEECSISKGSLESYYYTETGGNIIDLDNYDSTGLNKGIFVWPTNSCSINYESETEEDDDDEDEDVIEDYLNFDDASLDGNEVSFSFDRETAESNDIDADVMVAVEGDEFVEESFSDSEGERTIELDKTKLRKEFGEGDKDIDIELKPEDEGEYQWNRQTVDLESLNSDCGEGEVWSDYAEYEQRHACVKEDLTENIGSKWELNINGETKYRFNTIKAEENTVRLETGENGYCGELNMEREDMSASTVEINMEKSEDSSSGIDAFYEIDGDRKIQDLDSGESKTSTVDVSEAYSVEIGVNHDNSFNCAQGSRTIDLTAELSWKDSGPSKCGEDEYYDRGFDRCLEN